MCCRTGMSVSFGYRALPILYDGRSGRAFPDFQYDDQMQDRTQLIPKKIIVTLLLDKMRSSESFYMV